MSYERKDGRKGSKGGAVGRIGEERRRLSWVVNVGV